MNTTNSIPPERMTPEQRRSEIASLLVAGSAHNFKVTYPQDFALAQAVLLSRTL